jgi:hypothetical protein
VHKPDKSLRLCLGMQEPNKAIIPYAFPLPTFMELSAEFHNCGYFSKLDLKSAYNQVPLHQSSRNLTALIPHIGCFRYTRVPIGMSSAPSAMQKIIASVLKGIKGVKHLLDDIIVSGHTLEEHDERLRAVLKRFSCSRLYVECQEVCTRCAAYRGCGTHAVGGRCYTVTFLNSNVKAILDLQAPRNKKEVMSLIGSVNYYGRFIPHFSELTYKLRMKVKDDTEWSWGKDDDAAVQKLKQFTSISVFQH